MPKTLITQTGPNFIQKEDVPSDGLGFFSNVQHYEKQLGINGITGNTIFTLTKPYVIDSDTLMVFINGQKAEKVATPSVALQYEETDLLRVTFGASLDNADVVEFMVLGTYEIIDTTQLFMPPGFVFPIVNSNTPPVGTLACEGGFVSKTTYSALFSGYPLSLGTFYGDGGATFALPDYRGRFMRGRANGSANDPDRLSRIGGDNVGSTQNDEFKSHVHSPPVHWLQYTGGGVVGPGDKATQFFSTNATGGSETRPKNIYVMYCIKY
jgi:hypothetical protein